MFSFVFIPLLYHYKCLLVSSIEICFWITGFFWFVLTLFRCHNILYSVYVVMVNRIEEWIHRFCLILSVKKLNNMCEIHTVNRIRKDLYILYKLKTVVLWMMSLINYFCLDGRNNIAGHVSLKCESRSSRWRRSYSYFHHKGRKLKNSTVCTIR